MVFIPTDEHYNNFRSNVGYCNEGEAKDKQQIHPSSAIYLERVTTEHTTTDLAPSSNRLLLINRTITINQCGWTETLCILSISLAFGFLRCFFKLIALRAPCLWVGSSGGDMGETTLIVFITIKVIALSYQFGFYFCLIVLPIESTLNYTGDRHSPTTHNHFQSLQDAIQVNVCMGYHISG